MTDATEWQPVWKQVQAAVSPVHRFGADALLLADFSTPRPGESVVELGTGCGAVALRLCAAGKPASVLGIDIAPDAIALCRRSADAFPGEPRPVFAVADWAYPRSIAPAGSARLVVCNPPYFPPDSGKTSTNEASRTARHEAPNTLPAICAAARWLLTNGGRFCLCHRPERLNAVLAAVTAAGLEPKRLRPVHNRPGESPWLFLLEARKGGRPGLQWEPPVCLCTETGDRSTSWHKLYNE